MRKFFYTSTISLVSQLLCVRLINHRFFTVTFARDYPDANEYAPYLYAGMLFNVSVKWLDDGCAAPEDEIARTIVDAIYP